MEEGLLNQELQVSRIFMEMLMINEGSSSV